MFRWGLLGTSFISAVMARAIAQDEGARVHAVAGRNADTLADLAASVPGVQTYGTLDDLLADPEVDAVYVAWPNHLHAQAVTACARAGRAVLCEKSFGVNLSGTDAALGTAREAGVFVMEGLMYLTHPLAAALRDVVASGELGELRVIQGTYAADIFRFVNPGSRGAIFNLGCYPASLAHLLLQAALGERPLCAARLHAFGNPSPDGNVGDTAATLHLPGGPLVQLHAAEGYGAEQATFSVTGTLGTLRCVTNPWMPLAGTNTFTVQPHGQPERIAMVEAPTDAYATQVRLVRECVQAGQQHAPRPAPRPEDTREIMQVLTAWETSVWERRTITLA
ncbi:Gfo/Idh/MocA family protein [Deinococcus yunweiensis]|uniref:Gfo/Idh/MocA family protein n=1 Tax=Deinococcus yunweiensis TaxID=367282 RepID=UPI00398F780F